MTETIRLSREDGTALHTADVTYETSDGGTWVTLSGTEDNATGDLVYTETFPVPANLNALSHVRIIITLPAGTVVKGRSEIKQGSTLLASDDYEFTVTA